MFKKLFNRNKKELVQKPLVKLIEKTIEVPYKCAIYRTELQIIFKNNQIICADYVSKEYNNLDTSFNSVEINEKIDFELINPVKDYLNEVYKLGVLHTVDKSNKYHVAIKTDDIQKIIYKLNIKYEDKIFNYTKLVEETMKEEENGK